MNKIATKINNACYGLEKRQGIFGTSLLVGLLLMATACLSTTSRWEVHFHGGGFSLLSENPFDLSKENVLRFRILSPLLGYIFFMRGAALYLYFMLFVMTAFISGIYMRYRKKQYSGIESIGMASLMAFSSVVYYIFYYPAYNDPTSYLLILLCMSFYRKPAVMTLLIMLLLFNHENNAVLFPWLFYIMNREHGEGKIHFKTFIPFLIAAVPYLAYRTYINMHVNVGFSIPYYFKKDAILWTINVVWKHIPAGIFEAFKLFWLFPLLAMLNYKQNHEKKYPLIFSLIFFGVLSQMIIVWDISRLICLAFPMILMGAEAMKEKWGKGIFAKRLWLIILLNFLVPTYLIGALEPILLKPLIWQWITNILF